MQSSHTSIFNIDTHGCQISSETAREKLMHSGRWTQCVQKNKSIGREGERKKKPEGSRVPRQQHATSLLICPCMDARRTDYAPPVVWVERHEGVLKFSDHPIDKIFSSPCCLPVSLARQLFQVFSHSLATEHHFINTWRQHFAHTWSQTEQTHCDVHSMTNSGSRGRCCPLLTSSIDSSGHIFTLTALIDFSFIWHICQRNDRYTSPKEP